MSEFARKELRSQAEGRMASHGKGALIRVQGSKIVEVLDEFDRVAKTAGVSGADLDELKTAAREATEKAGAKSAEAERSQEVANDSLARAEKAETELALARDVVTAANARGRRQLPAALKAYNDAYGGEDTNGDEPEQPAGDGGEGEGGGESDEDEPPV